MRSFRLLFLPLIVGGILLICSVPQADAATIFSMDSITRDFSGYHLVVVGLFDLKGSGAVHSYDKSSGMNSVAAAHARLVSFVGDSRKDSDHLYLPHGNADRVWVLAFVKVKGGSWGGDNGIPLPSGDHPVEADEDCIPVGTPGPVQPPVNTPEPSSLVYLGLALGTGGLWMKRRKF